MYRTIDTALWSDPAVRQLKSAGKLLFLYLITNPHAHVGGLYYLPTTYILHDTGLTQEALDRVWDTLSSSGLASLDRARDVVWVRNMFRYQGRGEKMERAAAAQLKTLHNSPLIKEFLKEYPSVKKFYKDRVSKGHLAQDESGIQEQEQEQDILLPASPAESTTAEIETETAPTPSDCDSDTARIPSAKKPRQPDLLFDAVAALTGSDPKASGTHIGRVCKALRKADPPYTAEEVLSLPAAIRAQGLDFTVTLGSVEKYIGWVRNPPTRAGVKEIAETEQQRQARILREREQDERARAAAASPAKVREVVDRITRKIGVSDA